MTELEKMYHFAHLWRADGSVSALCYAAPRPINLRRVLWTIRTEGVTCKKCLAKLARPGSV